MAGNLTTPSIGDEPVLTSDSYTSDPDGEGTPRYERHLDSPSSELSYMGDADEGLLCRTKRPIHRWTWRLVWCQERSHKQEQEPLRDTLSSLAAHSGGILSCYKKANKFEAWVKHSPRPPYILLTDGREAKPCVQALRHLAHNQPVLIAVLAEQARHAARIQQWVRDLPREGIHLQVVVIGSPAELPGLLAGCIPLLRKTGVMTPLQTGHGVSLATPLVARPTPLYLLPRDAMVTSDMVMTATTPMASPQHCMYSDATRCHVNAWLAGGGQWDTAAARSPLGLQPSCSLDSPFFLEAGTHGVTAEVLQVLAPAVPRSADANALRIMLDSAAPSVYED